MKIMSSPCGAHTLDLCIKQGCKVSEIEEILLLAAEAAKKAKTKGLQEILKQLQLSEKIATPLQLIRSCPTRWTNNAKQLERMSKIRLVMDEFIEHHLELIRLTTPQWNCLQQCLTYFEPCNILSTKYQSREAINGDDLVDIVDTLVLFGNPRTHGHFLPSTYKMSSDELNKSRTGEFKLRVTSRR